VTAAALAWAAGAALLQLQAGLPTPAWALVLPFAGWLAWWRPRFTFVLAFALGFAWAAASAHWRMDEWLDPALEGRDIEVRGVVSSLPARGERSVRFELDVEEAAAPLPRKLLLSWYAPSPDGAPAALPELHPGERWRFVVRLRRPHGTLNPHGFDYEAWLLERGIGATGYVRPGAPVKLGERKHAGDHVERLREAVRERFFAVLGHRPAAGILAALAVGDQRAIANEEWQLFNATGVTHLMSISGLHVTLISGLVAWLVAAFWRSVPPLALRLAARRAGALSAIAAALAYTTLAGFAIPAQRTFYMVSVVALALWFGRIASPMRVLALALAAVVAADPWAPLAPGFWLSFGAVALIFYVGAGWNRPEPWWLQCRACSGPSPSASRPRCCCSSGRCRSPARSPMPWPFRSSRRSSRRWRSWRQPCRWRLFFRQAPGSSKDCCSFWNGAPRCRERCGDRRALRPGRSPWRSPASHGFSPREASRGASRDSASWHRPSSWPRPRLRRARRGLRSSTSVRVSPCSCARPIERSYMTPVPPTAPKPTAEAAS